MYGALFLESPFCYGLLAVEKRKESHEDSVRPIAEDAGTKGTKAYNFVSFVLASSTAQNHRNTVFFVIPYAPVTRRIKEKIKAPRTAGLFPSEHPN